VSEPSNLVLGPLTWQDRATFSLSGNILWPGTLDDYPRLLILHITCWHESTIL
jgi:hypothetical protein